MLDDYDTQIQCEEYYNDDEPSWEDLLGPDDDTVLDDDEDMLDTELAMPGVFEDDPDDLVDGADISDLFDANGGLTADAYAMLAEMDSAGEFI